MAFKVLVVDDSTFFRRRVTDILNEDPLLEVIGDARNGQDAIDKVLSLKPDVVTMDVEMPVMDGIQAVREIMRQAPLPILMFSSLTHEGASATLDALDAGALDFMPKKFEEVARNLKDAVETLRQKVKTLARKKGSVSRAIPGAAGRPAPKPMTFIRSQTLAQPEVKPPPTTAGRISRSTGKTYQLVAIGASTGGPVALQKILTKLPAHFPLPIVLVQHMPGTFTRAFAERLDSLCNIRVKEAEQGEMMQPGTAYLAPGGRQMLLEGTGRSCRLAVTDAPESAQITYKPSVDLTFESIAKTIGGDVLAMVLTGMGADGREGCKLLKQRDARIWVQDEQTSVVYGMPQAVASAGLADASHGLEDIAGNLLTEVG